MGRYNTAGVLKYPRSVDGRNAVSAWRAVVFVAVALCVAAPALRAQWVNYRIPGVPRTPDGKVNLTAPTPRTADGKPDLSGTWESAYGYFQDLARDLKAGEVVMQPWAKAVQAERESNIHANDLLVQCMPPGVPRINTSASASMVHPFKIVQTPSLVVLLYETSANSTFRQVFLDGRPLPADPQPSWLGYSIGHWEGDTLVVETIGFNGKAWLDTGKGHPQSEEGRVTERFTRRDFGHLEIGVTIDDPKAYAKPWSMTLPVHLLADSDLIETYCENEKDTPHMK
jgi:hypothetical protein